MAGGGKTGIRYSFFRFLAISQDESINLPSSQPYLNDCPVTNQPMLSYNSHLIPFDGSKQNVFVQINPNYSALKRGGVIESAEIKSLRTAQAPIFFAKSGREEHRQEHKRLQQKRRRRHVRSAKLGRKRPEGKQQRIRIRRGRGGD